ncbi:response regulator transcription factor [Actinospica durhamensis]|uniref:Response regulator transcription factor n=1 Tax=Actinospica durhamensis TaxID=1508375 RepID=A0A941EJS8_9ACTN|nr:response regulator transcription factor [Actinospica durhamensis]MBR7832506.1 response regulator transcription factor [Actinospica durhamensis]
MLADIEFSQRPAVPAPEQVTLLVVIANELLRHGLISMLRGVKTVAAVTACGDEHEALELLARQRPGIVVCRACDPCAGPVAAAVRGHGARLLLLLEDLELGAVDETTMLAAQGFLIQREATLDRLRESVDRLAAGEISIPAGLARALITRGVGVGAGHARGLSLTAREHQVLSLLAQGLSNKQIARRLTISEHGVKRHVTNLLAKMDSPNRTLAVATALRQGLVTVPNVP